MVNDSIISEQGPLPYFTRLGCHYFLIQMFYATGVVYNP